MGTISTRGTRKAATAPDRATIVDALRASYEGPAWHGPSVRIALRGVPAVRAAAIPAPGRNAIWEMVLHLAYARHRLLHRLRSLHDFTIPSFPRKLRKPWFPELPDPLDERRWKEDQELLARYQQRLLDVLETVPEGVLLRIRSGSERPIGAELLGLALHDVYHAGQIRLLDRMAGA